MNIKKTKTFFLELSEKELEVILWSLEARFNNFSIDSEASKETMCILSEIKEELK